MKSDSVKNGIAQAPARSLFNALGYTEEERKRPLIGIVCSYNEIVPGHMNLDKIVDAVKLGVAEAGGMPVVVPAIAVCDGIAMGHVGMKYSLVTRDLICDSTEAMAMAHGFDALVMVPNCDKNVPGLLMAAARLDLPCTFVSGGPMLAGRRQGVTICLFLLYYSASELVLDSTRYDSSFLPINGFVSFVQIAAAVSMFLLLIYFTVLSVRANGRRVWHWLFWILWWAALGGGGYCEYLVQRHGGWYLSCYFAMSICALIMAFIVHRFYLSCCGKEEEA